ncbi:chemotaxis protein CheW [Natrinema marinum]|uniref:chemotaxis protein CheW n=1 Tax=Natrinema marinum TaxID=2961598 RepID=UPI0020C865AB|nr:chemotaxis protein CheW [Natrinema marinum]
MAPDLSETLLGTDNDAADRTREAGGDDGEEEELVQFVFVGVGEHRLALPVDAVRTITEPPTELTRVPRSPPAVEGLMDLRGEITAVIDAHVHFPTTESRSGRERLLVLDRPSDQQSAAIRVDDVIGVETVPESDVLDGDAIEASEFDGDALDHPLVVALVRQEQTPRADVGRAVTEQPGDTGVATTPSLDVGGAASAGGSATLSSARGVGGGLGESVGETFELEGEDADAEPDAETGGADEDSIEEISVEATPLVDVDRLLLASGQAEDGR